MLRGKSEDVTKLRILRWQSPGLARQTQQNGNCPSGQREIRLQKRTVRETQCGEDTAWGKRPQDKECRAAPEAGKGEEAHAL